MSHKNVTTLIPMLLQWPLSCQEICCDNIIRIRGCKREVGLENLKIETRDDSKFILGSQKDELFSP